MLSVQLGAEALGVGSMLGKFGKWALVYPSHGTPTGLMVDEGYGLGIHLLSLTFLILGLMVFKVYGDASHA